MVVLEDPHEELPAKQVSSLQQLAELMMINENVSSRVINLVFVNEDEITKLNRQFLNHPEPTDVIAFPLEDNLAEPEFLGEVYICAAIARQQAQEWHNSFEEETARLVIHGVLHLLGYDHLQAQDESEMKAREELYLNKYRR